MNFRLDLCIYMDNRLVVFLEKFLLLPRFFVKNAKKNKTMFLKLNGFGVKYFIKSKYRRIQTGLAILKNIKDLIFFSNDRFFTQFSKIAVFRDF